MMQLIALINHYTSKKELYFSADTYSIFESMVVLQGAVFSHLCQRLSVHGRNLYLT